MSEKKEIKTIITHLLPQGKPPLDKSDFSADFSLSVNILASLVFASCRFTNMWFMKAGIVKNSFSDSILRIFASAHEEGDD